MTQVVFAGRADGWLYSSGHVWATHDGGASWRQITLPGTIWTIAASAHAVYAAVGGRLYSSPPAGMRGGGSAQDRSLVP